MILTLLLLLITILCILGILHLTLHKEYKPSQEEQTKMELEGNKFLLERYQERWELGDSFTEKEWEEFNRLRRKI